MGSNDSTDSPPNMMQAFQPESGWKEAIKSWGPHWTGFTYSAIVINSLLLLWTSSNLIYICIKGRSLVSRKYLITLNLMVLIFSVTKLLFYAIDPKSIKGIMPKLAGNILNNSSFPALTVGFYVLYVALRQCTVPNQLLLPLILKTKVITGFVIICFTISYLTDIVVAYTHSMELMILLCQIFYIIWGFVFFCLYIALVITYKAAVEKSRKKMKRTCYRRGHCRRDFNKRNIQDIPISVKISCLTAIFFLTLSCLNIYLVLIEIGLLKQLAMMEKICNQHRQIWSFFSFNVILMAVEHLMAAALAIAGTQPLKWLRLSPMALANRNQLTVNPNIETSCSVYAVENDIETSFTDVSQITSVHSTMNSDTDTSVAIATSTTDNTPSQSHNQAFPSNTGASIQILSMQYLSGGKIT